MQLPFCIEGFQQRLGQLAVTLVASLGLSLQDRGSPMPLLMGFLLVLLAALLQGLSFSP